MMVSDTVNLDDPEHPFLGCKPQLRRTVNDRMTIVPPFPPLVSAMRGRRRADARQWHLRRPGRGTARTDGVVPVHIRSRSRYAHRERVRQFLSGRGATMADHTPIGGRGADAGTT
jgi:hypothetical protein